MSETKEGYMKLLVTGGYGFIGSNFINYYFKNNTGLELLVNLDALYYCANENNVDDEDNDNNHKNKSVSNS